MNFTGSGYTRAAAAAKTEIREEQSVRPSFRFYHRADFLSRPIGMRRLRDRKDRPAFEDDQSKENRFKGRRVDGDCSMTNASLIAAFKEPTRHRRFRRGGQPSRTIGYASTVEVAQS